MPAIPVFRSMLGPLWRVGFVLLASVLLTGCLANPYWTGAAGALVGPQVVTGRNTFYNLEKWFGRSCADYTLYDMPVRCINDP